MTGAGRDNDGPGREYSAGGVVTRRGMVLLVRVQNLKGEHVWTFPKGHVEMGESARQAALREVEEETGYRCHILKPLLLARYMFRRDERLIHKKVQWYWMRAGFKTGGRDEAEVEEVKWVSMAKARALLKYPSDSKLLTALERLMSRPEAQEAAA